MNRRVTFYRYYKQTKYDAEVGEAGQAPLLVRADGDSDGNGG